ncbi:hypothetical protein [Deinococcus fonticola]|uniref:hypothetical protein n=1 Tax=Deinococcus fonticola TaxID=2528713 RepID=UPI00142FA13C|nr:hypothetical protein [Deinococcus fonticola]
MTAAHLQPVNEVGIAPQVEIPAPPVRLPEAGQMLNVMLRVLLLILLSGVLMHYL